MKTLLVVKVGSLKHNMIPTAQDLECVASMMHGCLETWKSKDIAAIAIPPCITVRSKTVTDNVEIVVLKTNDKLVIDGKEDGHA